jgi:hypothetical protein
VKRQNKNEWRVPVDRRHFCLLLCNISQLLTCVNLSVFTRPHDLVYLLFHCFGLLAVTFGEATTCSGPHIAFLSSASHGYPSFFFYLAVDIPVSQLGLKTRLATTYVCIYCHWAMAQFKMAVLSHIVSCASQVIWTILAV